MQDNNTQTPTPKKRARAKTGTSFPNILYRGGGRKSDLSPAAPTPSTSSSSTFDELPTQLSMDALLKALTPPAVPSLAHARALVLLLQKDYVQIARVRPVVARLCAPEMPGALLSIGLDVLAAAVTATAHASPPHTLSDIERASLFTVLRASDVHWAQETWKARANCFAVLTADGSQILGLERPLLSFAKTCIFAAFDRLLTEDDLDRPERITYINSIAQTMKMALEKNPAYYTAKDVHGVLEFFESYVNRSLEHISIVSSIAASTAATIQSGPIPVSPGPTSALTHSHRRNVSSTNTPTTPSHMSRMPSATAAVMSPLDLTVFPADLYITFLESCRPHLSVDILPQVITTLLRLIGAHITPLPRISATPSMHYHPRPTEAEALAQVTSLLTSPLSTTTARHIRSLLASEDKLAALGAFRTVRSILRDAGMARMSHLLLTREDPNYAYAYSRHDILPTVPSGSVDVQILTLDRLYKPVGKAIQEWSMRIGSEIILEEALGINSDIVSEACDRLEDGRAGHGRARFGVGLGIDSDGEEIAPSISPSEGRFIGAVLSETVKYVQRMRVNKLATPLPIDKPASASTPLLLRLCTQLALPLSTPTTPRLHSIILSVSSLLSDAQTLPIPAKMHELSLLTPTSSGWLDTVAEVFRSVVKRDRPNTARQVLETVGGVHDSLRGVPPYRKLLGKKIVELVEERADEEEAEMRASTEDEYCGCTGAGMDGDEFLFGMCMNELVWRIGEAANVEPETPDDGGPASKWHQKFPYQLPRQDLYRDVRHRRSMNLEQDQAKQKEEEEKQKQKDKEKEKEKQEQEEKRKQEEQQEQEVLLQRIIRLFMRYAKGPCPCSQAQQTHKRTPHTHTHTQNSHIHTHINIHRRHKSNSASPAHVNDNLPPSQSVNQSQPQTPTTPHHPTSGLVSGAGSALPTPSLSRAPSDLFNLGLGRIGGDRDKDKGKGISRDWDRDMDRDSPTPTATASHTPYFQSYGGQTTQAQAQPAASTSTSITASLASIPPIMSIFPASWSLPHTRNRDREREKEKEQRDSSAEAGSSSPLPAVSELVNNYGGDGVATPPAGSANQPQCRPLTATVSLIMAFQSLAFSSQPQLEYAVQLFKCLLEVLDNNNSKNNGKNTNTKTACSKARLAALQLLMRLRADREHVLYVLGGSTGELDDEGDVRSLAGQVDRVVGATARRMAERGSSGTGVRDEMGAGSGVGTGPDVRRARSVSRRILGIGTKSSGGDAANNSNVNASPNATATKGSRSRSRLPPGLARTTTAAQPSANLRPPLWMVPESLPFTIPVSAPSSGGMKTYEPNLPPGTDWEALRHWVPVSEYVLVLVNVLASDAPDWEILSYVLCHLPVQLANRHFFCGPKTKEGIVALLLTLCTVTLKGDAGRYVADQLPETLRLRDAVGLTYHSLVVLINYRRILDERRHQEWLVEMFIAGLNTNPVTIKVCLNALAICAVELPLLITKHLAGIMEVLSRLMTNAAMAVHILDFVSIVGSLPPLYANFREEEFKLVFAVAIAYIHHHNTPDTEGLSGRDSFALSQHVLVVAYFIIYVWFLALDLEDRPKHVQFIVRRLLLANEAKGAVDEPTEVCFDWLARYTYATADPRPTYSLLGDIVMNPASRAHPPDDEDGGGGSMGVPPLEQPSPAKTWLWGNSLVSIRTLPKRGWIEVQSVRPSGETRFLCKLENFPQVGPGDVDPDWLSDAAVLMMDRDPEEIERKVPDPEEDQSRDSADPEAAARMRNVFHMSSQPDPHEKRPDPVSGYVWGATAPSQRRKNVSLTPSFFALQLSQYPALPKSNAQSQLVTSPALRSLLNTLRTTPVIDTHKVAILYVAPGQMSELEILSNEYGSPAYTRFLESMGRLLRVRDQRDVYLGGMVPEIDGEYAYAWWDDIVQVVYHTTTLMPNLPFDPGRTHKKKHVGNDKVRIVWNDSGLLFDHNVIKGDFNFVSIVIEPHSLGTIAAFSDDLHERESFKVTMQCMPGMPEFGPIGEYKLVSAENLAALLRPISLLADFMSEVYVATDMDTSKSEYVTNWRRRLQYINKFRERLANENPVPPTPPVDDSDGGLREVRDFTRFF